MQVLQDVVTPAEKMAEQVAKCFTEVGQKEAAAMVKELAVSHNLTYGEASALTHVASCMIHGKRWKK